MRRVLVISPHFPPDSGAASHRVRLLAPHLARYGWEPTVLTVAADAHEGAADVELGRLVPSSLRIIRVPAISARTTRRIGIGDLGIRSWAGLFRAASRLLRTEHFDAVFITVYPAYTALLGPFLFSRFRRPIVLDYIDPWVNSWGATVGGGPDGSVDLKSRASLVLARTLEPFAVRAARAITAVSPGTYEPILQRNPTIVPIVEPIPYGAEQLDFEAVRAPTPLPWTDGMADAIHVCYTGTILPLGTETLTAVLQAVALLRTRHPSTYSRLRLHFIGTSNQTTATDRTRVLPLATRLGLEAVVDEIPTRLPYLTTIHALQRASLLLAMGSSEPHYTASKIYPMLLARRPIVAVYHERSTVVDILRAIGRPPTINVTTYSADTPVGTRVEEISRVIAAVAARPEWNAQDIDTARLHDVCAETVAGRLARVLDRVTQAAA